MSTRARVVSTLLALALVVPSGTAPLIASVAAAGSLPACTYRDVKTAALGYSQSGFTLLDTIYKLPSSYAPRDLRSSGVAGGGLVRSIAVGDLRSMFAAAKKSGAPLSIRSSYRSYGTQASTFSHWVRVGGYGAALRTSARPGHSEHQLGTAIDVTTYGGRAPWNYADWGTTRAGSWMHQNAWKYGFVMSYPKGKSAVTCYSYEPWHYRYVGKATAIAIHTSGLTPREWIWLHRSGLPG